MSESHNIVPDNPPAIWRELGRAVSELNHPWRTPALATGDGSVRTIVLRSVDEPRRELVFHTDLRSPKIARVSDDPRVEWLFYNPGNGLQIRARATTTVHTGNESADVAWRDVPTTNRINYCSHQAPGTPLSDDGRDEAADDDQSDGGYQNFAVVTTQVASIDWLLLAPSGNRRRLFEFSSTDNEWNATDLVP